MKQFVDKLKSLSLINRIIIGVLQDSCETAVNSSTDVLFTASAEFAQWKKEGRPISVYPNAN